MSPTPVAWLAPASAAMAEFVAARCPPELSLLTAAPGDDVARRAMLAQAQGAITGGHLFTAVELIEASAMRAVQLVGVGWQDRVPVAAMRDRGVRLAICPLGSAQAVAEHAVMLMLAVRRGLVQVDRAMRAGRFDSAGQRLTAHRLAGSMIGLVGMGAIARRLAALLAPFDVTLLYWSRTRLAAEQEAALRLHFVALTDLLGAADIVSLHLPGGAETRHRIGAREIAAMKPGAAIINTARGALIDQDALVAALRAGRLGGAGLDVFDPEPPAPDDPLLALDNVIVTPHCASAQVETFADKLDFCFANLARLFASGDWNAEITL
ncbi:MULTISPECIES: 2-hydroxyacid dehydrogenase [unclassified Sphingobium]|uniref:2-hydroxyacid dehydrogenase n=1 Tax=unclassified Sphingobium TaxID=2611147 RepID=UPI00119A9DF1|nr:MULTISPECIES: NAD(P)-dependent oxidoreductase [unclassified Sphingobium]MBG6120145.1 phosphoglycerate dehydrogenase-like enzyme [Sphingobium sp. JAI105]TWD05654.1 D-3-phosphoglycerate dehydrogenase [Sphingobium sp. AEW010]TWD23207.1 D-3-phosphoglycerate dehydrogenase [Sphingobium sp. AEW013]TWD25067.1 D-3-phosphoglycerate dehydrogenase [Sphingobium sp. AEW001]